jgi:SAM-dependent methyltransferase
MLKEALFKNNFYFNDSCLPINFLNKIFKSKIYINKITGSLIFKKYYNKKDILKVWEKRFYSTSSSIYETYSSTNPYFLSRHTYVVEFLKEFLKKKKINSSNMKFADIGCGNGTLLNECSKRLKYKEIIGFDYSANCIKKNKKTFKKIKNLKFLQSSAEEINNKVFNNYFDVIFITWTLSSCSDPLKFMENIYKLLKNNGIVIVGESSRILVYPSKSIYSYFSKNNNTGLYYPWRFSFNSLRNLLTYSGFLHIGNNRYDQHNDLIIISKKKKFKKKFIFDNYKLVIHFLRIWLKKSKTLERINIH